MKVFKGKHTVAWREEAVNLVRVQLYFSFALHGRLVSEVTTKMSYVVCPEQETVIGCCYDNSVTYSHCQV